MSFKVIYFVVPGVFSTAFVFYEKLAKLLNAPVTMEDPGDWRVDSGIVSVAIQTSGHHRQLKSPVKISMATNKVGDVMHTQVNLDWCSKQCKFMNGALRTASTFG